MKHIFTLSLCFLALSLSAQETITYPYNPDGDADGLVAVPDIQDLLAVYGSPFSPAEIMVGDTALSEWIQILYQALQDQQEVLDSLQANLDSQETFLDSTMIADMISAASGDYSGFGATYPNPINLNTEYYALKDGFLTGTLYVEYQGQIIFRSDTTVGPNIIRANFSNSNYYGAYFPFTLPIRKGEYYWFNQTGSGAFSGPVFFTELISSQDEELTSISYVDFSQEVTAIQLELDDLTDMIVCRLTDGPFTLDASIELPTENVPEGFSIQILNNGIHGPGGSGIQLSPGSGNDTKVKNGYIGSWTYYDGLWYTIYEKD